MKRISTIVMALIMVITIVQCKKNEEQPTSNEEVVTITLDVNRDTGSKVLVNSAMGTVDFESGDKVYVGSGGKYVGFLTHNGTNFVGNITNPTENQPLQFYFLGNVTPTETLAAGTTEECSVLISDQTEHLPVISCAASCEDYVSCVTSYTSHLLNKCALVKFNVTTPSNSPICIAGMHNKVTVDFAQNTITPSQDGEGVIMLPAGSGENVEKWAILLPQEVLEEGEEGTAYSEDGVYSGTRPEISEIAINGYYSDGIVLNISNRTFPEGAIRGLFTINNNGDQVYFSKGNLQNIGSASTPYWKFADNQWEMFGTSTGQNSTSQNVDRDLFGWGTSGFNHGAVCFQPWSTSQTNSDYYAYGYPNYNLNEQSGKADWGYNAIRNVSNHTNSGWRTLTFLEWSWVLHGRNTALGINCFAKAQVNNVNGIILLPDNWDITTCNLYNVDVSDADYSSNVIDETVWNSIFEKDGAVFLPAAGQRNGTVVGYLNGSGYHGSSGYYWSSNADTNNGLNNSWAIYFSSDSRGSASCFRYSGCSVRLVKDHNL